MFRAALIYTVARIAILGVLLALLWLAHLVSYPGILLALLLSIPASYFLLGKQRADLTAAIAARRESKAAIRARLRGSADRNPAPGSDGEPDRKQDAEQ